MLDRPNSPALPMLATRVADPAAIPAADRQACDIYEYIVAMSGGFPA